jgi:hypothetical protein
MKSKVANPKGLDVGGVPRPQAGNGGMAPTAMGMPGAVGGMRPTAVGMAGAAGGMAPTAMGMGPGFGMAPTAFGIQPDAANPVAAKQKNKPQQQPLPIKEVMRNFDNVMELITNITMQSVAELLPEGCHNQDLVLVEHYKNISEVRGSCCNNLKYRKNYNTELLCRFLAPVRISKNSRFERH